LYSQSACLQNFVPIGWTVTDCKFSIPTTAAVRHLQYLIYANFNFFAFLQSQSAYWWKISSWLNERFRKYCKFTIFNMSAVRHLELRKYANFNFSHCLRPRSTGSCKISSWSDEPLQIHCKFLIIVYCAPLELANACKFCSCSNYGCAYLSAELAQSYNVKVTRVLK